jgi:23S rRNA A2030 N6-methylase RlmJ
MQKKVKLLKDEFTKYTKATTIQEDGFVKIGNDLGIDIYSDVSCINSPYFLSI